MCSVFIKKYSEIRKIKNNFSFRSIVLWMITKITCRYSFEVLDLNCNDFGFTFNIGVSYLGIFIRMVFIMFKYSAKGTNEVKKIYLLVVYIFEVVSFFL